MRVAIEYRAGVVKRGFTLVELLVVIAIIGILVALLLPAIQAAREAARRSQCQSNLKNVALAVLNYESQTNSFPAGTVFPNLTTVATPQTPVGCVVPEVNGNFDFGGSWVVSVLPFLEYQELHDAFIFKDPVSGAAVPMRDDRNIEERGTELPIMLCPSDGFNRVKYNGGASVGGANWARGNYAANVGTGALYPTPTGKAVPSGAPPISIRGPGSDGWNNILSRGVMGPNAGATLKQITDGTSKTMMLAELRAGIFEGDPRGTWAFGHAGGNLVVFHGWGSDGNGPNYCGPNADDIAGTGFLCTDAQIRTECMSCFGPGGSNGATSRSAHPGGVHVAMCDASVQFISDDIETGGALGSCCKAWDYLILSMDNGYVRTGGRP